MKLNGGITYLNGQRFRLTIKLSASTGKEYCESTEKCNSKVKLFTSTGRDLDYIREYLPALVHNQRSASFDKCVYSFSILLYDVTIHGFNNNNTAVTILPLNPIVFHSPKVSL